MISLKNVSFKYVTESTEKSGVHNINLSVSKGECVVLCGHSGCGKSTLLRIMNGLIPHYHEGHLAGQIHIDGKVSDELDLFNRSKFVGSIFQNPSTQFFNVDTTSEIAFGCENRGLSKIRISERIDKVSRLFELSTLLNRSIFELSGGEKQRIACASIYAAEPELYIMDEPAANLDKASIEKMAEIIRYLKSEGKTIVISEHQFYYLKELADKYVLMKNGTIDKVYSAAEFIGLGSEQLNRLGLRVMEVVDLSNQPRQSRYDETDLIRVENLMFKRGKKAIVDISELKISKGDILAITGENGAGKSTFIQCLCGLHRHKGKICYRGNVLSRKSMSSHSFLVMQDVNSQLFAESVYEEVILNIPAENKAKVESVLRQLNLYDLMNKHPMALSGGEKQRVAIASALLAGKEILIFDEPTSGLDYLSMERMSQLVKQVISDVFCVIIVTHDRELIQKCCTRKIKLHNGRLLHDYSIKQ